MAIDVLNAELAAAPRLIAGPVVDLRAAPHELRVERMEFVKESVSTVVFR